MLLDASVYGTTARLHTRAVFFELGLAGFRARLRVRRPRSEREQRADQKIHGPHVHLLKK
jgi:hypothetical protein